MEMQVKECRKSFKYTNMYVVTYEVTTTDFFTGVETTEEKHIFSMVPVEPGKRTVVKDHKEIVKDGKTVNLFWIKEVKA